MADEPRKLKYPLYNPLPQAVVVDTDFLPHPEFAWPTDNPDERVNVTLNMSLNEYIAIATAVDVGRDIAYGDLSEYVWWVWNRAKQCASVPVPTRPRGSSTWIPDGVQILYKDNEAIINICEDTMPITINVYECCGVPNASGSDGTPTSPISTSSNAGLLGGGITPYGAVPTSPCDVAYTIVPYIINQARIFLQDVETGLQSGLIFADALATSASGIPLIGGVPEATVETYRDTIENCTGDAINALVDADFIYDAQKKWVSTFGNATQQVSVTRQDLNTWSAKLPLIWGSIVDGCVFSPKVFFSSFTRIMNVSALNARMNIAASTSTTAFCEAIYADTGAIRPALSADSGVQYQGIVEYSGYRAYLYDAPATLSPGQEWTVQLPDETPLQALLIWIDQADQLGGVWQFEGKINGILEYTHGNTWFIRAVGESTARTVALNNLNALGITPATAEQSDWLVAGNATIPNAQNLSIELIPTSIPSFNLLKVVAIY